MKKAFIILFMSLSTGGKAQKQCECLNDPGFSDSLLKENLKCDTTILKNKSILYYQSNCDSIWLVLENVHRKKYVLFSAELEWFGYLYRLGYQLIKEFDELLLFRWGCPANGPCNYMLVNKSNGKKIREFGELIYNSEYLNSDFIIYFSNDKLSSITVDFIDLNKKYIARVPPQRFKESMLVAEQQFDPPVIKKNILTLTYRYKLISKSRDWETGKIIIDLKKAKQ